MIAGLDLAGDVTIWTVDNLKTIHKWSSQDSNKGNACYISYY